MISWRHPTQGVCYSPRYRVTLTQEERKEPEASARRGKIHARRVIHARALLLCAAGVDGSAWNVADIAKALGITSRAIEHLKKRFVADGLHLALNESYDVMIVDIMLPKLDGLALIKELRVQKKNTPVIILSAKRAVDDRVKGLQTGGDDYLTKPFAFSELLARIQALIRRSTGSVDPTTLEVAGLRMDLLRREVTRSGDKIDLQPREFVLLEYLMRNAGRVVSKTMIMEHVWDYNFDRKQTWLRLE